MSKNTRIFRKDDHELTVQAVMGITGLKWGGAYVRLCEWESNAKLPLGWLMRPRRTAWKGEDIVLWQDGVPVPDMNLITMDSEEHIALVEEERDPLRQFDSQMDAAANIKKECTRVGCTNVSRIQKMCHLEITNDWLCPDCATDFSRELLPWLIERGYAA